MIQFYLSVLLIVIIGLVLFTNKEHFQTCDESNINLNAMNIYDEHSKWLGINLIFNVETAPDASASESPAYVLIQDKNEDKPIVVELNDNMKCNPYPIDTDKLCYTLNSEDHFIYPNNTYIISLNTTDPSYKDKLIVSNSIQITTGAPKLSEDNLNSKCGWNSPQKKLEDMFKKNEFEITL